MDSAALSPPIHPSEPSSGDRRSWGISGNRRNVEMSAQREKTTKYETLSQMWMRFCVLTV